MFKFVSLLVVVLLVLPQPYSAQVMRPVRGEFHEIYLPKPEMVSDEIPEPEARPSPWLAYIFTGLIIIPFVCFIIRGVKLGVVGQLSFAPAGLLFHFILAVFFTLIVAFWLHLSIFQTLKGLLVLVLFACVTGRFMMAGKTVQ